MIGAKKTTEGEDSDFQYLQQENDGTASCCALNDNFSVPENKNKSYAQIPPCTDSDIFPCSPAVHHGLATQETTKKDGYLLLSVEPKEKPKKKRGTVVRRSKKPKVHQQVSTSGFITHGDDEERVKYKVQSGWIEGELRGIYLLILHKMIAQIDIFTKIYSRSLLIRFELHQSRYTKKNTNMSTFFDKTTKRLKRVYKTKHVAYGWAREQEKAKAQHYHCFLLLDGHKVQYSSRVNQIIRTGWESVAEGNSIFIPENCFYDIKNQVDKADAVYRISYLCKSRGKGYRAKNACDYGTSRLRPKTKINVSGVAK